MLASVLFFEALKPAEGCAEALRCGLFAAQKRTGNAGHPSFVCRPVRREGPEAVNVKIGDAFRRIQREDGGLFDLVRRPIEFRGIDQPANHVGFRKRVLGAVSGREKFGLPQLFELIEQHRS